MCGEFVPTNGDLAFDPCEASDSTARQSPWEVRSALSPVGQPARDGRSPSTGICRKLQAHDPWWGGGTSEMKATLSPCSAV